MPPYYPLTDAEREALQAFEDEVIDRLYLLNNRERGGAPLFEE